MNNKPKNQQLVISLVLILSLSLLVTLIQFDPSGKYYDPILAQEEAMMKLGADPMLVDPMAPGQRIIVVTDPAAAAALIQHRFGPAEVSFEEVPFEEPPPEPATEEPPTQQTTAAPAAFESEPTETVTEEVVETETPEEEPEAEPEAEESTEPTAEETAETATQPTLTITPVLKIYLEGDTTFDSGPYPIDTNIIFDISESLIDGEVMGEGALSILWALPDGTTATTPTATQSFADIGAKSVSVELSSAQPAVSETETADIQIYNGLDAILSAPADNTQITPGVFVAFKEESTSLTEPITSWIIDLGDGSEPWGYLGILGNQQACFSATVATSNCVTGILKESEAQGDACACSSSSDKIYPTTVISTSIPPGVRYHKFNSTDDCGTDGICTVTLTVSSENYSDTDTINLKFDTPATETAETATEETNETEEDICVEFPGLAICQDEPPATFDTTFDPITTEDTGSSSFVSQDPPARVAPDIDPIRESASPPPQEPEGTGIGGIVITLLLLSALAGAGFLLWKRGFLAKLKSRFQKKPPATAQPAQPAGQPQIKDFIDKAKAAGESDVVIRQNLKNAGWPEDEINRNL